MAKASFSNIEKQLIREINASRATIKEAIARFANLNFRNTPTMPPGVGLTTIL